MGGSVAEVDQAEVAAGLEQDAAEQDQAGEGGRRGFLDALEIDDDRLGVGATDRNLGNTAGLAVGEAPASGTIAISRPLPGVVSIRQTVMAKLPSEQDRESKTAFNSIGFGLAAAAFVTFRRRPSPPPIRTHTHRNSTTASGRCMRHPI